MSAFAARCAALVRVVARCVALCPLRSRRVAALRRHRCAAPRPMATSCSLGPRSLCAALLPLREITRAIPRLSLSLSPPPQRSGPGRNVASPSVRNRPFARKSVLRGQVSPSTVLPRLAGADTPVVIGRLQARLLVGSRPGCDWSAPGTVFIGRLTTRRWWLVGSGGAKLGFKSVGGSREKSMGIAGRCVSVDGFIGTISDDALIYGTLYLIFRIFI